MTSETFEQVLIAAEAAGSLTAAWKKFVNTRFFVPVVASAPGAAKPYALSLAPDQALHISEVRERLAAQPGASVASLSGADVIRMLQADASVQVALSDRAFSIAHDRADWLRKGIEAAQAKAAARAMQSASAPLAPASPAAPAAPAAAPAAPAAAPAAPPVAPPRRSGGGVLDVAALKPRSVTVPRVGLEFFVPSAWTEMADPKGLRFADPDSGMTLLASGAHRPDVTLAQWQTQRLAVVQHEMRYLTQDGDSYALDGEGWRDRVRGSATEFAGTFPGDDFPSRYLVACIRTDDTVASIVIRAPADAFDQQRQLYKWLLSRVDLLATAAIDARAPAARASTAGADDELAAPGPFGLSLEGRITRLQALAYSFPVWLPLIAVGILAAVVAPKSPVAAIGIGISGAIAFLWLALRLLVLRLHDTNISGKWILYYLGFVVGAGVLRMPLLMGIVALLGWLAMMVFYCLVPGTDDDNDFGPPPGDNSGLVKLGAALFILLQVASVAGPAKLMRSGALGSVMGLGMPGGQGSDSRMVTFMPPDASFMVDMPGLPSEEPVPAEAQLGGARMHLYQVTTPQAVYMAQTIDVGSAGMDRTGTMDAMESNLVGRTGTLIASKTVLLNGMKGRDVRVSLPDGTIRGARYIIVGSKIRMAMMVTAKGTQGTELLDRYLTSFKLPED